MGLETETLRLTPFDTHPKLIRNGGEGLGSAGSLLSCSRTAAPPSSLYAIECHEQRTWVRQRLISRIEALGRTRPAGKVSNPGNAGCLVLQVSRADSDLQSSVNPSHWPGAVGGRPAPCCRHWAVRTNRLLLGYLASVRIRWQVLDDNPTFRLQAREALNLSFLQVGRIQVVSVHE